MFILKSSILKRKFLIALISIVMMKATDHIYKVTINVLLMPVLLQAVYFQRVLISLAEI